MAETELVKNLRDLAAIQTKGAHNPFAERKLTFYWKAADEIERLRSSLERIATDASDFGTRNFAAHSLEDHAR